MTSETIVDSSPVLNPFPVAAVVRERPREVRRYPVASIQPLPGRPPVRNGNATANT